MKILVVVTCLVASMAATGQTNYDTVRIHPVKITEQIYMLKGAGGNVGVLIGKEGTLLIDNQFAPLSNKINGAVKTLDPGEIRFAINTHLHGDHSGGNENLKKMGATLVAHNNVRERMMKETTNRAGSKVPPRNADAWPMVTFADRLNFHLNDEDVVLHYMDRGHTDGDVIVQFVKANVVHTGDAFVRYGYPYIDLGSGGSVNGFVATLDKVLVLVNDNTRIIPGHGELATKADVKKVRDMVADVRDQVAAALKKGKKPEEIPGLGITNKYDAEYGKGFVKGKDFVMVVLESLQMK
ncbi:MAG: MBL fold metallo-hydrolase [Cytophagales bacterium]|nr:MBL fold metallo-hydrolase [Cytophagales bacterium]